MPAVVALHFFHGLRWLHEAHERPRYAAPPTDSGLPVTGYVVLHGSLFPLLVQKLAERWGHMDARSGRELARCVHPRPRDSFQQIPYGRLESGFWVLVEQLLTLLSGEVAPQRLVTFAVGDQNVSPLRQVQQRSIDRRLRPSSLVDLVSR
jgi:hypothetical protein